MLGGACQSVTDQEPVFKSTTRSECEAQCFYAWSRMTSEVFTDGHFLPVLLPTESLFSWM